MRRRGGHRGWRTAARTAALLVAVPVLLASLLAYADALPEPPVARQSPGQRFDGLTVHHTASGHAQGGRPVDVEVIAGWHRSKGLGHGYTDERACAYHYVVLPDGEVQAGRPLAEANSGSRSLADRTRSLAVVLVGDFEPEHNRGRFRPDEPTPRQLESLRGIALWACGEYGFGPERVRGHGEVSPSDCPGERMDMEGLRRSLKEAAAAGQAGTAPPGADGRSEDR